MATGLTLLCFIVEFWDGTTSEFGPVLSVRIHTPSCWTVKCFLNAVEESFTEHGVIYLIEGYTIYGMQQSLIIINTLHHISPPKLKLVTFICCWF